MRITGIAQNSSNNITMTAGRRVITTELVDKANQKLIKGKGLPWPIIDISLYLQSGVTHDGDILMLVSGPFSGRIVSKLRLTPEQINEAFRKACEGCKD